MIFMGHVINMEVIGNTYRISVRKPEVKRLFGRTICRYEGNIKMDLK
jgi:hypothetical protein